MATSIEQNQHHVHTLAQSHEDRLNYHLRCYAIAILRKLTRALLGSHLSDLSLFV